MIELIGWLNIQFSTDGEHNFTVEKGIISQIYDLIKPLNGFNHNYELKCINGNNYLYIGINHNHDNEYLDEVKSVFSKIAKLAIGSYGLVYLRQPEDELYFNEFKVIKLNKGEVTIQEDSYLSPCNPKIED
jgi:hypothetical protein